MKQFFLLGSGISRSLSPQIHATIYRELGENAVYRLLDVSHVNKEILPKEFDGFNVTIPHKTAVISLLDSDKSGCGSVNTVVSNGGVLTGYSTDGDGFLLDAQRLALDLSNVLVVGTGGAALSIVHALTKNGHKVSVKSRDYLREKSFAAANNVDVFSLSETYSLAVNCTPVTVDFLPATRYYSLSYHGGDGLGMLIYQAILSAELFLNKKIQLEMFDIIMKDLQK